MANPLKGEARVEVDNVVYTITFDVETVISIEHELKRGWFKIINELKEEETFTFDMLRTLMWCALIPKHPNITRPEASRIIQGLGGPAPALRKLLEAFEASFPEAPAEQQTNPMTPSQTAPLLTGSVS